MVTIERDGVRLRFNGEEEPTQKLYKYLQHCKLQPNDRVLLHHSSGTSVVVGVIGPLDRDESAAYAAEAGHALEADHAQTAEYAAEAGRAGSADEAARAVVADTAEKATSATTASWAAGVHGPNGGSTFFWFRRSGGTLEIYESSKNNPGSYVDSWELEH